MANFIKLAIIANCLDQEIVNVLYYAPTVVDPASALDPLERASFLTEFEADPLTVFVAGMYDQYEVTELQATAVNESNETTSDYAVVRAVSVNGANGGPADSLGLAMIIGFQCSYPFTGAPVGVRVPRKSYIAYGPMVSSFIDNDGGILVPTLVKTSIGASLTASVLADTNTWMPVRVGVVGPESGTPAVGKVDSVIFRPYARPRKSRMKRANGR